MKLQADFITHSKVSLLIFLILLVATIILAVLAAIYSTFPGDEEALRRLQELERSGLSSAARAVTRLGNTPVVAASILALVAVLWAVGRRRDSIACLLIPVAEGLGVAVKALIGRPRPEFILFPPGPDSAAFPSGHAIHAVLFFGFLLYLTLAHTKSRGLRVAALAVLPLIILIVGASRVYLGLHWPSDVLGGYIFGGVFLWVLLWTVKVGKREPSVTT